MKEAEIFFLLGGLTVGWLGYVWGVVSADAKWLKRNEEHLKQSRMEFIEFSLQNFNKRLSAVEEDIDKAVTEYINKKNKK
jgi:hypothetical protein